MKRQGSFVVSSILTFLSLVLDGCAAAPPTGPSRLPSPTKLHTAAIQTSALASASTNLPATETSVPATLTTTPEVSSSNVLAFASDLDGDFEIYVMNLDGSEPIQVTFNHDQECCIDWSPDGSKMVFGSDRDGGWEIYVMNADGSDQTRLTRDTRYNANADWSPDGKTIAFESSRDGDSKIYLMNPDGTQQRRLTNDGMFNSAPTWSPDGTKIAYESKEADNPSATEEIFVMNADGSNPLQLTHNEVQDLAPVWSPDGTRIAYGSTPSHKTDEYNPGIYVVDVATAEITQLTFDKTDEGAPVWTMDGKEITFASCTGQVCDIFIMNEDGSNIRRITDLHSVSLNPSWSPLSEYVNNRTPDCTSGWTQFEPGMFAAVAGENDTPNRVRSDPGLAGEVIAQVYPGTPLEVVEGPICADGLVFWKVRHQSIPNGVGWTAEGDGQEYWLDPYTP